MLARPTCTANSVLVCVGMWHSVAPPWRCPVPLTVKHRLSGALVQQASSALHRYTCTAPLAGEILHR